MTIHVGIGTVDTARIIADIHKRLGALNSQTPDVLRRALNDTARAVRKQIVKDARGQYQLADAKELGATRAMALKSATKSRPSARLTATGPMKDLIDFMVSPGTMGNGRTPSAYSAKVLKSSSLTALTKEPKPFITTFKSGHKAIVARVPGRYYSDVGAAEARKKEQGAGAQMTKIVKLLSPAVPHMLQNQEAMGAAQELVRQTLPAMINKEIERAFAKGGGK